MTAELPEPTGDGIHMYAGAWEARWISHQDAYTAEQLIEYGKQVEAHTREECAKVIEQDLYPDDACKPYTQQYNDSIKRLADKIRGME